jgi:transcription antitermination protein NusB
MLPIFSVYSPKIFTPALFMTMALSPKARHKARTFAMQMLYQWQLAGEEPHVLQHHFMKSNAHHKVDWDFFQSITDAVFTHHEAFNALIENASQKSAHAPLPVERALLWLGLAEFQFKLDVPYKVIISEYVALAEEFAATEGYKFVNGILDSLAKTVRIPLESGKP